MENEILNSLMSARKDLATRLLSLKKEAETVKIDIDSLDRIIQRYQGQKNLELSVAYDTKLFVGEYEGKTLRESVLDVLNKVYPSELKVLQIRKRLISGGYQTTSPNFDSAIFGMLSQMVKAGDIEKVDKGLYKAKQNQIVNVK